MTPKLEKNQFSKAVGDRGLTLPGLNKQGKDSVVSGSKCTTKNRLHMLKQRANQFFSGSIQVTIYNKLF